MKSMTKLELAITFVPNHSLQNCVLEIENGLKVHELCEFLRSFKEIKSPIQNWICYSFTKGKYLNSNDNFENFDTLDIFTDNQIQLNLLMKTNFKFDARVSITYSLDSSIIDIVNSTCAFMLIDKNDAQIDVYINDRRKVDDQKLKEILYQENKRIDTIEVRVNFLKPREIREIKPQLQMYQNIPMCDSHFNNPISQICTFNHICPQRKICTLCPFDNHKNISKKSFIPFQLFAEQLNEKFKQSSGLKSLEKMIDEKFKILESNLIQLIQKQKNILLISIKDYEMEFQQFEQLYQDLKIQPIYECSEKQIEDLIKLIYDSRIEKLKDKSRINNSFIQSIFQENEIRLNKLQEDLQYAFQRMYKSKNQNCVGAQIYKVTDLQIESSTKFEEIFEYLELDFEKEFDKCIKIFGSYHQWKGYSQNLSGFLSASDTIEKCKINDVIMFGPIDIIIIKIDSNIFDFKINVKC